jgi:hypothetical protein
MAVLPPGRQTEQALALHIGAQAHHTARLHQAEGLCALARARQAMGEPQLGAAGLHALAGERQVVRAFGACHGLGRRGKAWVARMPATRARTRARYTV